MRPECCALTSPVWRIPNPTGSKLAWFGPLRMVRWEWLVDDFVDFSLYGRFSFLILGRGKLRQWSFESRESIRMRQSETKVKRWIAVVHKNEPDSLQELQSARIAIWKNFNLKDFCCISKAGRRMGGRNPCEGAQKVFFPWCSGEVPQSYHQQTYGYLRIFKKAIKHCRKHLRLIPRLIPY